MNGAKPSPWKKYPKFAAAVGFSPKQPDDLQDLDQTPLAEHLKKMFSAGITRGDFSYRSSFWTKNEEDDRGTNYGNRAPERSSLRFNAISPESVDLSLKSITSPRDYVSLLLGGGTNLWSNVDFSAAFATCVTGNPVIAHIVDNEDKVKPLDERERFTNIAARLRPGLAAVITKGTATKPMRDAGALDLLNALQRSGFKVYAKTGTLKAQEGALETSRIVLAIIRWDNEQQGLIKNGLVFSIVGEQAQMGTSAQWLGQFIVQNRGDIERLLGDERHVNKR